MGFRLDEQARENGVALPFGNGGQSDLGIADQPDPPRFAGRVDHAQPSDLDILGRRHQHVQNSNNAFRFISEFDLMRIIDGMVRTPAQWHFRGRPYRTAFPVPKIEEMADVLIHRSGTGQCHGIPAQIAIAASPKAQGKAAIAKQMAALLGADRHFPRLGPRNLRTDRRCLGHAVQPFEFWRQLPWYALIQQKIDGLHSGIRMKERNKEIIAQGIADCRNHHALVMGHEGLHRSGLSSLRTARCGKIKRLVKAKRANGAQCLEVL